MTTRRNFLKTATLASAGLAVGLRANAGNSSSRASAGGRVNLACIGIGNRGEQIIDAFDKTGLANVVALCDVDLGADHTQKMLARFPKAKRFKDFRQLFDKMGNEIEAVCIAVPDHAHFPISMLAISLGKHVYVEKPMARTFLEAELMMDAARKHPEVVTQVGNQGHSGANYFQFKTWVDAGIIKDVTAISAHMNNDRRWHKWDINIYKLPDKEAIPETLDWDTWMSAVPYHEYNAKY
ncbi:MAG: Gfo/Idh/MocA family oxidoreductase, partial [Prevotellaceae bacterium]|nr:Gfo/Idh/MocA family oxidoreductase [Prevotellaceae bacterium]